jgi:hypothetical protein
MSRPSTAKKPCAKSARKANAKGSPNDENAFAESGASPPNALTFPPELMVGTLGDFAREAGRGNELPEVFLYFAALTFLGAYVSRSTVVRLNRDEQPRLYTVLVGASGDVKKSACMNSAARFFRGLELRVGMFDCVPKIQKGLNSAEGLVRIANGYKQRGAPPVPPEKNILCTFDEFASLMAKGAIDASVLLDTIGSLFAENEYSTSVKNQTIDLADVHLSLLAGCTDQTWENVWTSKAIDIGLDNRILIVTADAKPNWVGLPEPPNEKVLAKLRVRLTKQIKNTPSEFSFTASAKKLWESWYRSLRRNNENELSGTRRRLDTIGIRLAMLIALTTDKREIDDATVRTVTEIMNYAHHVRKAYAPIDAETFDAHVEQAIMRALWTHGPLSRSETNRRANVTRFGKGKFSGAVARLVSADDIRLELTAKGELLHPQVAS